MITSDLNNTIMQTKDDKNDQLMQTLHQCQTTLSQF